MNRKIRAVRTDRIVEQHVHHGLVPIDLRVVGERRGAQVSERLVVTREGFVVGQGDARGDDLRLGELRIAFVNLNEIRDPQRGGVGEQRGRGFHVQITRTASRVVYIAHRGQRHAEEQVKAITLRLEKRLKRDVVRDLVGRGYGQRNRAATH